MKKSYIKPQMEIVTMEQQSVICYSGGYHSREDNYDEEDYY